MAKQGSKIGSSVGADGAASAASASTILESPVLKDWFVPAILSEGSVRESLDAVLVPLQRKHDFIVQLKARLCSADPKHDSLTILGRQVKELENTLRFRLGILQPDRHTAWFREAPKKDFGPFKSSLLMAPVISPYELDQLSSIKESLYDCWHAAKKGPLAFKSDSPSLWTILIEYRAELEGMAQLATPYSDLRLDILPDGLPEVLDSRALRAFLINVRGEFKLVRDRLNVCFDQLWRASEKLWLSQAAEANSAKKKETTQGRGVGSSQARPHARRAPPRAPLIGFADMEAMRFFGFRSMPAKEDLRQRYLELAKKLHPDREGGSEESFKQLSKAYKRLAEKIGGL